MPKALQPIKYNGFLEDLYHRVEQLKVVSVEMTRVQLTDPVRAILLLPPKVTEVVRIKRCRHVKGPPFSFTVNYLPMEIGARLNPAVLKTVPLNTIFERDLKIPVMRGEETVEAAPANPEIAQLNKWSFTESASFVVSGKRGVGRPNEPLSTPGHNEDCESLCLSSPSRPAAAWYAAGEKGSSERHRRRRGHHGCIGDVRTRPDGTGK